MATKKKVAKKKTPKPSTLLASALALFGPKGQNWITGSENSTREDGYERNGQFLQEADAKEEMREIMPDVDNFNDPLVFANAAKDSADKIAKEFKFVPGAETYCSIGAIFEVNTPNQNKAVDFLAMAIDPDFKKNFAVKHNPKADEFQYKGNPCKCNDCANRDAHSIITGNNDDLSDDPDERMASFKVIKSWFTKAIKLAKAANQ